MWNATCCDAQFRLLSERNDVAECNLEHAVLVTLVVDWIKELCQTEVVLIKLFNFCRIPWDLLRNLFVFCHRVSFRPLPSFTASSAVWLCVPLRVSFSPLPVGSNLSTKLMLKRPKSKPARQAYLIWRQVMMLMHDDPNLASLKHSKRSYLTIDEYDYILNRLKSIS